MNEWRRGSGTTKATIAASSLSSRRSRPIVRALALLAVGASVAACGSERPAAGDGTGSSTVAPVCVTPQDGCPCNDPGASIECGTVERRSGDYVTCSMGYRTCGAGKWGSCNPTSITAKSVSAIHPATLATTPTACADPCDPYCSQYVDTPAGIAFDGGGMTVVDGGLTINPGAISGGGLVSVGFTSNPGGVTNCSPDRNIVGAGASRSCTPPGLGQCQQDFHCDGLTSTCLWSGGLGYKDPGCSSVDLTLGAACGPSGSAAPSLPLCNRGTGTLPSGATITLHESNGASPPDACTNLGAPTCTYTMPVALTPGQCVTLTYCQNSPGTKFVTVNAGVPGAAYGAGGPAVAECSDAPAGARCQNNGAYMKTDGSTCGLCQTCNTTLTGKVFDPSGTTAIGPAATGANNLPLAGISVFQPSGSLLSFVDGVTCDTCASLQTPYQTGAVTDATGSFTMNGVSPGASGTVPIVVQSGRWRRKINVTSADLVAGGDIVACANNALKDGALRMPRSAGAAADNPTGQSGVQRDIPKIALVVGDREGLECWVRKIGIADSEIRPRLTAGNTARVQLFRTSGAGLRDVNGPSCAAPAGVAACTLDTTATERTCSTIGGISKCVYYPDYTSANQIGSKNFYGTASVMNEFSAALLPCDSDHLEGATYTTWKTNLSSYVGLGGRLFMDHLTGEEFLRNGPAPLSSTTQVSTWQNWADPGNGGLAYAKGWIPTPTTAQSTFGSWMSNVGASPFGAQTMQSDDPKKHALVPGTATIEWIRGRADNAWNAGHTNGDYSLSFSFETGKSGAATVVGKDSAAVSCGAAGGTGRVIFNGMHVSQARMPAWPTTSATLFPTSCTTGPLTSEEKSLEYQFFQLTACTIGGAPPPPPPPPPPPLPVVDYYRDYEATCAPGAKPVWQYFFWQSIIPTATTQVQFRAATATTQAALPAPPPGAAPATVAIGTANTTIPTGPLPAPQWASDAQTVEQNLVAQANVRSQQWLRVYMRFVPDNTTTPYSAPTLSNWRQTYDCVPNE